MATTLSASLATFSDGFAQNTTTNSYPLGVGQTWQNVTASRGLITTYTNSTGRPIMVAITTTPGITVALVLRINSFGAIVDLDTSYNSAHTDGSPGYCVVIPIGAVYSIPATNWPFSRWFELR